MPRMKLRVAAARADERGDVHALVIESSIRVYATQGKNGRADVVTKVRLPAGGTVVLHPPSNELVG